MGQQKTSEGKKQKAADIKERHASRCKDSVFYPFKTKPMTRKPEFPNEFFTVAMIIAVVAIMLAVYGLATSMYP